MYCVTVADMVDVTAFVRMSTSLWKMSLRTSQTTDGCFEFVRMSTSLWKMSLRTSQTTDGCFEYHVAVLLETHLKYYESNQLAYFILTASEGSTRTRRHALREESMREHSEDFVWNERQLRKLSRCVGLEHT